MERVCFLLRVRADRLDEYRARHREVWPCQDFERAQAAIDATGVNARWQADMAPFSEARMERLEEVFHLA